MVMGGDDLSEPTVQNLIFKIHSSRLAKSKWNLTLSIDEARKNDELVNINTSQMIRWIDELNGAEGKSEEILSLKNAVKRIRKQKNSAENRRKVHKIHQKLFGLQFQPDLVSVVMDRTQHFKRAAKGFKINGIQYVRLVATSNGVKLGVTLYISERLSEEIRRRIDNGRNKEVELVPAKLEAYRALTCSGSTPVTTPRIAVVPDCETKFFADVINISDGDGEDPIVEYEDHAEVELCESDGYGLMSPEMAAQWADDLGLDYVPGGFCTRWSWEKGMLFPIDFIRFSDEVAGTRIIKDVWGDDVDLSNIDVILSTSMLKLYQAYNSCQEYVECCTENHYQFSVTKYAPASEDLDIVRHSNYQFIQSMQFSDDDLDELLVPTISYIEDILSYNPEKATLYLHGTGVANQNPRHMMNDYTKALLIDERLQKDVFVQKSIASLLKKRITGAKIGILSLHANFTIIGGDPYSFMQNMHGLEVTGLLKPHELYSSFWRDRNVKEVLGFRAPMSAAENIVKMKVSYSEEAADWFTHIKCVTLLSSFSAECHALNGADKHNCPLRR